MAQQELEKNALRAYLQRSAGDEALVDVRKQAEADCLARYGVYISYDDANDPDRLENTNPPALISH